ncbi:MAG TPA: glycerate-2-kinase family protein, partial [Thermomicrobiales bacterium]|nr:glycerate-2-kinase family protein [Thermomicrobiales bacterium]
MAASRRETIEAIYRAAIDQVEAGVAVSRVLSRETDHALTVGDQTLDIGDSGVWAIAIGKAGCQMMASVETIAGDRFAGGLVVTKSVPVDIQLRSEILVGSHPVPDARSLEAGERLIDFVRMIPDGALVICLISGGGSALADALRPGVTLEQLRDITATLLRSGASIGEMNAVRARLSRIKGGGLLALLNGRRVVNLIISDVLGNPL